MEITSTVLLSAFEPFGGADHNPSQAVVEELTRRAGNNQLTAEREEGSGHGGVVVIPALLPVEFNTAGDMLRTLIEKHSPTVVIAVGLAAGTEEIRLERVGLNLRDARIPDNAGAQPAGEPIVPGGANALFSTLRLKSACQRIAAAQIPVRLSLSAGSYVCNDVLYTLLHHIATNALDTRGGFVHVPQLGGTDAAVTVEQAAAAVDLLIAESLTDEPDDARPGGALH